MQVGQLVKQLVDIPTNTFNVNTQINPNEKCSLVEDDRTIFFKVMEEES